MNKFDRAGTVNAIEWLEADVKEEIRKKTQREFLELKLKQTKTATDAVSEMYRAIAHIENDIDLCFEAKGKVHLCYVMGFISHKVYTEINNYLQCKVNKLRNETTE